MVTGTGGTTHTIGGTGQSSGVFRCPNCSEVVDEGANFCPNCQHKLRGGDELAQITSTLVEETNNYRGNLSSLSPHWSIPEEHIERQTHTIPKWAWITGIASVFAVILVFIILKLWLWSIMTDATRQLAL